VCFIEDNLEYVLLNIVFLWLLLTYSMLIEACKDLRKAYWT